MSGPAIGYNYDLRQLDMWDDRLQQWVNPNFQGGTVGGDVIFEGSVTMPNIVDNCWGMPRGTLWNNGWTVSICPGTHHDEHMRIGDGHIPY